MMDKADRYASEVENLMANPSPVAADWLDKSGAPEKVWETLEEKELSECVAESNHCAIRGYPKLTQKLVVCIRSIKGLSYLARSDENDLAIDRAVTYFYKKPCMKDLRPCDKDFHRRAVRKAFRDETYSRVLDAKAHAISKSWIVRLLLSGEPVGFDC
jgi:hypothetical protein